MAESPHTLNPPTPSPEFLNAEERERIDRREFRTAQEVEVFLNKKIDEAEARLKARFPDEESGQKVHIKFETLRAEVAAQLNEIGPDQDSLTEAVKTYTNQLLQYIGGQGIGLETGYEGAQEVKTLGAIPAEWEDVFDKINDEDLDWQDYSWRGNNVSEVETNLKINLIGLSKNYKDLIEKPEYKGKILEQVNAWIQKMKETGGSGGFWDNQVTEMDADRLYRIIGGDLAFYRNEEMKKNHAAAIAERDAEITKQKQRADNAEIERDAYSLEEELQRFFNTFVRPYQGPTKGESQYLELTFNDADSADSINTLTTPVFLEEGGCDVETIINLRNRGNPNLPKSNLITFLKEQLPEKFQEQKKARQSLIEKFGAASIDGKTINDRLTAIDAQLTTLADYVIDDYENDDYENNEKRLISTLATINSSIIEVFTQLDAMAVAVAENQAAAAPAVSGQSPEVTAQERAPGGAPAAGLEGAPAAETAAGDEVPPAGGAPEAETPEDEAPAGGPATVRTPEAVPSAGIGAPGEQAAPAQGAETPEAAASRSAGAAGPAERAPAAGARAGSTTRIDSFMANWNDKTPSNVLQDNNITTDTEMVVNTKRTALLVRNPEENFEPKDHIAKGKKVTVLASGEAWHVDSNNFVKVRYGDNQEGWVAFEYLKKIDTPEPVSPEPAKQPAPPPEGAPVEPKAPAKPGEGSPPDGSPPLGAPNAPPADQLDTQNVLENLGTSPEKINELIAEGRKFEQFQTSMLSYFHLDAFAQRYFQETEFEKFVQKSYKKEDISRESKKVLDSFHHEVIEPLKGIKIDEENKQDPIVKKMFEQVETVLQQAGINLPKQDMNVWRALYLLHKQGALPLKAFKRERQEGHGEKAKETIFGRITKPARAVGGIVENVGGHMVGETIGHVFHARLGEAGRSFLRGIGGTLEGAGNVPMGLVLNGKLFEHAPQELLQIRSEERKKFIEDMKAQKEFVKMTRSDWEKINKKKVSEIKEGSGLGDLYRFFQSKAEEINGKKGFTVDIESPEVQALKVNQLIDVLVDLGVTKSE